MRLTTLSFILGSTVLLFTQCKKDDAGPGNQPGPGNYSPLTAGSSWTYRTQSSQGTDTSKITATANTATINGRSYTILVSDQGDTSYSAKSGNDYFRLLSITDVATGVAERYLKDNVDINATWNDTTSLTFPGLPVPITAYLNHTMKAKAQTRTVRGKNYTDVVQVRLDLVANNPLTSSAMNIGGGDFYYANGIGLIDYQLAINIQVAPVPIIFPTGFNYQDNILEELLSSDIK